MNKLKINKALAALMMVASIFAGWQTVLIVAILLLIFTDIEPGTKEMMTKVIAFLLVLTLIDYGWDLIAGAWNFVQNVVAELVGFINSYLDYGKQISLVKLELYFFGAFDHIFNIGTKAVAIILVAAKVFFATGILFGKKHKPNAISTKIEGMIAKIINYVNTYGSTPAPAPAPAAPSAPVPPMTPPAPPAAPGA